MKKLVILFLLFVVVSVGVCGVDDVSLVINGEALNFDVPPVIENGRTLVPLRAIFEALGADVEWLNDTREIVSQFQGKEIRLQINNKQANNKGVMTTLDVPPQIKEGRTLVPLRFIAESLDKDVEWIADTRTVIINDKSEQSEEEPKEEIKEEPKQTSRLPETLEFGRYKATENYVLYIVDFMNLFGYENDFSFKATCTNRPELNSYKSLAGGEVLTYWRNEWKTFSSPMKADSSYSLYGLRYKDSNYLFMNPYLVQDNVKSGEVLNFEIQIRDDRNGEIKTYYHQWIW